MPNLYLTVDDLMKGEAHMKKKMDSMISEVMSQLGSRGRGKSKVRGNSGYYKNLVKIREQKKKEKPLEIAYAHKGAVKVKTLRPGEGI